MVEVPVKIYVQTIAQKAKEMVRPLSRLTGQTRSKALAMMAEQLIDQKESILEANQQDMAGVSKDLDAQAHRTAMDRIRITEHTLNQMQERIFRVQQQPDPVGEVIRVWQTEEGMQVSTVRVPLGVVSVISDMGPSVTVDSFAMCLKTGNVCIFRGGTEWFHTNQALAHCFQRAVKEVGVPVDALICLDRSEPHTALELIRLSKFIDAVIPRGNAGLRKGILEQSRVPVIGYDGGISHLYIDGDVDIPLAQMLVVNGKIQDPAAANALDTLLIHQRVARQLLPGLLRRLLEEFKIELRGCPKIVSLMGMMAMSGHLGIKKAQEKDWSEKFQTSTMALKIVSDIEEALDHIAQFGPGHTDTIVTRNYQTAMRFVQEVDAGMVLVNASPRLHGGEQLGLGPDVGCNINHFPERGPVTLTSLTCQKLMGLGLGHLQHPHPVPETYQDAMMLSAKF